MKAHEDLARVRRIFHDAGVTGPPLGMPGDPLDWTDEQTVEAARVFINVMTLARGLASDDLEHVADETHHHTDAELAAFARLPRRNHGTATFTTADHIAYDARTYTTMAGYAEPVFERVEHGEVFGGPLDGLPVTIVHADD